MFSDSVNVLIAADKSRRHHQQYKRQHKERERALLKSEIGLESVERTFELLYFPPRAVAE
jgi:hypothetical protein